MKSSLLKIFYSLLILAFISLSIIFGTISYFSYDLPNILNLSDYSMPIPSKILSRDGTVMAVIGRERRELLKFHDVPSLIIDAFLAAEDAEFFKHDGIDYLGITRAFWINLKAGRIVQGGSTITQQVAKALFLSKQRTFKRKIKDLLLAKKLENLFSKEEILSLYLNKVYLGGGYYGIKAAFKGYFLKELDEITLAEAAMIAGLLVAPSKYSPYSNPSAAITRQRYVLKRLMADGKISQDQFDNSIQEKIHFRVKKGSFFKAGYFTEMIRQKMISTLGEESFLTGGWIVKTTLDYKLQLKAEREILNGVRKIDKRQGYSGPLGSITMDELIEENKQERISIYKKESMYFTLNANFEREYELNFSLTKFNERILSNREFDYELRTEKEKFRPGIFPGDHFQNYITLNRSIMAVVTGINKKAQIIFINIMGVSGIITQKGYGWAYDRTISKERSYSSFIKDPSSILKIGDRIEVMPLVKNVSLRQHVSKKYLKQYDSLPMVDLLNMQKYVLCALEQTPVVQAALVSMDSDTGEIISLVGGSDFLKSQFNRAIQSKRQPGSAFKPILYAAALENNFTPASIIMDSPETLGGVDTSLNWKPRNYDGLFQGPVTLRNALEQSRNVPTIKMIHEVGILKVVDFIHRLGFKDDLEPDLSLALGSFGINLVELISLYAIFPNGGKRLIPRSILSVMDRNNEFQDLEILFKEETFRRNFEEEQVYDKRLSYLVTNLLKGVILHGTGRQAKKMSAFIGGKTGTTNNYVDAWFLGFSANKVTGVWTGMDDNTTLGWGETGARSALPIWVQYMKAVLEKWGEKDFVQPPGIVNIAINKKTGSKITSEDEVGFLEAFVEETGPDEEIVLKFEEDEKFIDNDIYYKNQ